MRKIILQLFFISISLFAQDDNEISFFDIDDPKPTGSAIIFRQNTVSIENSNEHTCTFLRMEILYILLETKIYLFLIKPVTMEST
jgi:hypothetical protein